MSGGMGFVTKTAGSRSWRAGGPRCMTNVKRKRAMGMSLRSGSARGVGPRAAVALLAVGGLAGFGYAQSAATPAATPVGTADTGATAWMLMSSAMVMVMLPGLALFYAGMVRRKNVLGTMMHSMAALGIIGIEWVVIGYAMAFGATQHGLVGWDTKLLLLRGITPEMIHNTTKTPELVFVM